MLEPSKRSLSFGAAALVLGVLVIGAPRAAHAIAATLVQVTNTAANPVMAQSPTTQSTQLVWLEAGSYGQPEVTFLTGGQWGASGVYTVPANESLVITDVDITPSSCGGSQHLSLSPNGSSSEADWTVSGTNSVHLGYFSGIVLPPGSTPYLMVQFADGCVPGIPAFMELHGYLTAN